MSLVHTDGRASIIKPGASGVFNIRWILVLVLALLSGTASAQDLRHRTSGVDATIDRGLAFLAKDARAWKNQYNCTSCHHTSPVIWSMYEAKQRGHAVDEHLLAELTKWVAESGDGKTGVPRPAGIPKALNVKAVWFALALSADPKPDAAVQQGLKLLWQTVESDQTENGSWASWPETRPPIIGNSDESMTALATLALLPAASSGDASAKAVCDKGIQWLATTKTDDDPQSIAMRLVLWKRLGRPAREWQPLVRRITARQNADGGWSQTKEMASDAWATGQALYALAHAGIKPDAPVIRRAHAFLAKTQREDGSWPMTSRPTKPGGEGAKSLVPIIGAGSAWAVLGLVAFSPTAAAQPGTTTKLPTVKPNKVGVSSERFQRIHDTIERQIADKRISGAVTLVARKGRVIHFETHGLMDLDTKKPMRKDALFVLASMTKPITGVAVMMLMDEGKLRLTDPVSKFLPEFKDLKVAVQGEGGNVVRLIPAEREITLQDLLTHTSGLGSGGVGMKQGPEIPWPITPEETLAHHVPRWTAVPLDFQPGTHWSYSPHAGIDVLARVVEIASGQSFDAFLRQRLFEPLGMKDTFFILPEDRKERLASIYEVSDKGLTKANYAVIPFAKTFFSGAIGLVSTAEDYFRFAQMLLNGGQWNGKRLLSPRAVELFASNHVGEMFEGQLGQPKGMGFGLTVAVVQDSVKAGTLRSNKSFGWGGSYGTYFWVDPKEQLVAIMMIQTSTSVIGAIQRDFETAVMQALHP